ncbi:MAG: efflux RND transporter permease subunit [Planctomycetes bacterium]|nr:efflux RND transporter permease subunit [Planctomycetota bacterium]
MRAHEHGVLWKTVRAFVTGPLSPLFLIVATLAGVIAVVATPREEEPQIVVPMADVLVGFPGASAEEVEKLVTTPLERLLWQIDGVEHVYSMSRRDGAMVTVRFFVGEDREQALVRLQSKIDAHRDQAPPGVSGWVVKPVEIDDVPIVVLTLWSASADESQLRRAAEELAARLDGVQDVSRSEIVGGLPREVRVELEPEALAARGLAPLDVVQALRAADASLAAGAFDRADERTVVVAGPSVGTSREVGELVIGAFDGRPVHVSDVARVVDGPREASVLTRVRFGPAAQAGHAAAETERGTSHPAVVIALSKKKGTNAVVVAEHVVAAAERIAADVLPSDMRLTVSRNWGASADEKVDELLTHLSLAIVTVIGLVAFSLGWREGLIVAAAVPITFALTLLVNLLFGYTINRVTLFALVLVLGLVCDDPIVDVENIHRYFAKRKFKPLDAVLLAVNEVRPPVIVATLAVILSFVPLVFITGMMGPYMRPMAINVPVAMAMSLLVAFTVTPWMSYLLLKPHGAHDGAHEEADTAVERGYKRWLSALVDRTGPRWALFGVIGGLMVFAVWLALSGRVPLKMLPYDNKRELELVVDLPRSATLETTDAVARELEDYLARVHEVDHVQTFVGAASPVDFNGLVRRYGLRREPYQADLRINLLGKHERDAQSHSIALRLRPELERIAASHGAKIQFVEVPPGPPVLATLAAEVTGPPERSYEELIGAAQDLASRISKLHGVVDVDDSGESPRRRLDFVADKEKAALHGVTTAEIATTLELALSGRVAATVHEPSERQPLALRVALDRANRSGAEELSRIAVRGSGAQPIPLGELGRFEERLDDQTIFHKDLERVVFVLGEVAGLPPADAVLGMQSELEERPLAGGARADWSGEGEWKITLDVFRDLGLAFAGALIAIYVLLVVETRSFGMPLLVMLAIPLGAIGILPGFWLLNLLVAEDIGGYSSPVWFTATGMIGMIALAGIVVRNSIILIDFMRHRIAEGSTPREAVLESGAKRLRPILLTAGAAMLGAWPITLDPIFSGLAWSLIFGLIASTVFTLVVVPLVYYLLVRRNAPAATPL